MINNSFTQFAEAFNDFIRAVRDKMPAYEDRKDILFIVDDLEKLPFEIAQTIFIGNVTQLQQIDSNFIYSAPIDLLYAGNQLQQFFKTVTLPMIKIFEKNGSKNEKGYTVLREMIFKRADKKLFKPQGIVDTIIENSGGNPRQVLQLLSYAHSHAKKDVFDKKSIDEAIHDFSVVFQRFLTDDDYQLLCSIDTSDTFTPSERVRFLLYHVALLEYNEFWWSSHPVVRLLPSYKECRKTEGASK